MRRHSRLGLAFAALLAGCTAASAEVSVKEAADCVYGKQTDDMRKGVRETLRAALNGSVHDGFSPALEFVFILQDQCGVVLDADDPKNLTIFEEYFRRVAYEMTDEAIKFVVK
jgi:hypothetical protein